MKESFTNGIEGDLDNLHIGGAFLTVGNLQKANTMTISWGSIGFMWRKPIFMILVRESRYSKEFLETGSTFTISIPENSEKLKNALKICGSKSGRDVNKEKEAEIKFIEANKIETPIVKDCNKYYECKVVLSQEMDLENLEKLSRDAFYNNDEDKHILYFGEILDSYRK